MAKLRLTYEDFLALPEEPGKRYELIGGELFVSAAPSRTHQRVVVNCTYAIESWVRSGNPGLVFGPSPDVRLNTEDPDVVQPDVVYYASGRLDDLDAAVPAIVVEVLSPSNRRTDLVLKRALYRGWGVREYWIVNADVREIEVDPCDGSASTWLFAGDVLRSVALPGFELPVTEIFRGLD